VQTDTETIGIWRHHMRDEADAAFLYRRLADLESVTDRKEIFSRLADVEDRHTALWRKILAEHGIEEAPPSPSLRARLPRSSLQCR